jgi:hypothetical protein
VHKDEQVLPANYAEGLRQLIAGGGGGGGPFAGATIMAFNPGAMAAAIEDASSDLNKQARRWQRRRRVSR